LCALGRSEWTYLKSSRFSDVQKEFIAKQGEEYIPVTAQAGVRQQATDSRRRRGSPIDFMVEALLHRDFSFTLSN
jgi:hypothetical protein